MYIIKIDDLNRTIRIFIQYENNNFNTCQPNMSLYRSREKPLIKEEERKKTCIFLAVILIIRLFEHFTGYAKHRGGPRRGAVCDDNFSRVLPH